MNDPLGRILDANANRASEAVRVMEDAARFGLIDADLAGDLKGLRHDLRAALELIGLTDALRAAWRDTPGDVGTDLATEAEGVRAGLAGVASAAAKRLGESLRAIEECAKAGPDGRGPRAVEALRYRAYELERRLLAMFGSGRGVQWRLCVLITAELCAHHCWEAVAEQALAGGADCLQLREKGLDDRELLGRARRLVEIVRDGRAAGRSAAAVINDRPDIAMLAGADGVHLGQSDMLVRDARRLAGEALVIGVSCATIEQARRAVREGADYCGLGPMFESATKPKPVIAGPGLVSAYMEDPLTARVPHLAIGGITPENAGVLAAAGCRGVAVSGAVCAKESPADSSRALCEVLAPTHWGDRRRGGGA